MTEMSVFNVYCDESCHLEHDGTPGIAWGAIICPKDKVREISEDIRALKNKYGLKRDFEAKWTKISPAKSLFYLELIKLFLNDDSLRFRGLVVPDKMLLDHARFEQSHDDWYYKMYYMMLRPVFNPTNKYKIFIDIKDTRGGPRTHKLHDVLTNSLYDFEHETIERVEQIRSHESELLQITDLLIGALTYANRGLISSSAKTDIISALRAKLGRDVLSRTSAFAAVKFNVLVWRAQEANA